MFSLELAGSITEDEYERSIPECCVLKTAKAHAEELMLCWGLVGAIEKGNPMTCGICEYAKRD